jgi:hypothetical protein
MTTTIFVQTGSVSSNTYFSCNIKIPFGTFVRFVVSHRAAVVCTGRNRAADTPMRSSSGFARWTRGGDRTRNAQYILTRFESDHKGKQIQVHYDQNKCVRACVRACKFTLHQLSGRQLLTNTKRQKRCTKRGLVSGQAAHKACAIPR